MAVQKYPIGHQDFKKIISEDYLYVDKTRFVQKLVEKGGYYLLSRPRRFGKSLFISTLDYLFQGEKELFKGLYVEDKWDFETYPVIRISFSDIGYRTKGLLHAIGNALEMNASKYDIILMSASSAIDDMLKELIHKLHQKYEKQVVILIDEYDKPIIDYLDKDQLYKAIENRGIMKSFYSILKDADAYLKLVFITGVSKFSQVSIFSDLNNLFDLTLREDFNEMCGISQLELEQYFAEEMKISDTEKIKQWYNGYRWDIKGATVYNPFSLLNFFSNNGKFSNFWYTTGTPTFLVEMCRDQKLYELENTELSFVELSSFNIENLQLLPVMFQTGYLTISGYDEQLDIYSLDYPNVEVKSAYTQGLLQMYSYSREPIVSKSLSGLVKALRAKSPDDLKYMLNDCFVHIPYDLWQKDNEHFYHAIVHLLFSLIGINIQSEVHTHRGRADAMMVLDECVYCFEFKLDKSAQEAIRQIRDRDYLARYQSQDKSIYAIGVNFSSERKEVEEIAWEVVD